MLAAVRNLEPLPAIAGRVLALAAREDVVPAEVCALVQADPALCAKLLRLANSAWFGFRREIATLDEAGVALGVDRLTSLALTACAGRWFRAGALGEKRARDAWREAVASALAARLCARLAGACEPERAYTAGLLQDVGAHAVERCLPAEHAAIAEARASGIDRLAAERAVLGVDHAQLGAILAERWSLPPGLCDAIRWHHAPERAGDAADLALAVHLGDELARSLVRGDEPARSLACGDEPGRSRDPAGDLAGPARLSAVARLDEAHLASLAGELEAQLERAAALSELG